MSEMDGGGGAYNLGGVASAHGATTGLPVQQELVDGTQMGVANVEVGVADTGHRLVGVANLPTKGLSNCTSEEPTHHTSVTGLHACGPLKSDEIPDVRLGITTNNKRSCDNYGANTKEPQKVRVKVKAGHGKQHILQGLGACLTSCESVSAVTPTDEMKKGMDSYIISRRGQHANEVTSSVGVTTGQQVPIGRAGSHMSFNVPFSTASLDPAHKNILPRPLSMVELGSTHNPVMPDRTSDIVWPDLHLQPLSSSIDASLHHMSVNRRYQLQRGHPLPAASLPYLTISDTTICNEIQNSSFELAQRGGASAVENGSGLNIGMSQTSLDDSLESRGRNTSDAGCGLDKEAGSRDKGGRVLRESGRESLKRRSRVTSDWVRRLQRNFRMPPQVREEENDSDVKTKRPKQLQAYVAWVNSQLKKKSGTRPVDDLSQMKDGVALAHLIEIVANERLEGVTLVPTSTAEMIANVENVLHFMTSRRIRMHLTTAPDIVQGNPKSIMRLILALAAHYKPKSVKHSASSPHNSSGTVSPRAHTSLIGIAHGAATALADARRDAAAIHPRPQRPPHLDSRFHDGGASDATDSSRHGADPERGTVDPLRGEVPGSMGDPEGPGRPSRERGELEGASCGSSPRSSMSGSPKVHRRLDFGVHRTQSHGFEQGYEREEEVTEACDSCEGGDAAWLSLADEHDDLASDLAGTKRWLHQLQELLLNGQLPETAVDPESKPCEGATAEEQLVVLKSKLQHTEVDAQDLRDELSKVKNETMQLQGTRAGLQNRLADQEEAFLKMKAELLRVGFAKQSLQTEKADLERKVMEKDRVILDLRRELGHRDRQIEELVASLQFQQQDKEMSTRALQAQIIDLHEKLQLVGDTEVSLSHRLANQDRKMALLEGKLLHTQFDAPGSRPSSGRSTQSSNNDDIQVVRDSLQSLRSFVGNDPNHHSIDALEHSISSLMERLQMSEASRLSDSVNTTGNRSRVNYDSTGEARRSPISSLQVQGMNRLDSSSGSSGGSSTKVLYFTDRVVTPFMCTIPRRLGEITLRDFRAMFDRHGQYRFHFKAMDPEFGTVKEEITNDDDIIPGWDGKIVAWIEEDHA